MSVFGKTVDTVKKISMDSDTIARNIWLAGLGAYAKGLEEVNDLSGRSRTLFEELVERGREVQSTTKEKAVESSTQSVGMIEDRIGGLVRKLTGLDANRLENVDEKLDQLAEKVEMLLKQQGEEKPAATISLLEEVTAAEQASSQKVVEEVAAKPAAKKPTRRRTAKQAQS